MRIVNFIYNEKNSIGALKDDYIYDLRDYIEFDDIFDLIKKYEIEDLNKIELKNGIKKDLCKLLAPITKPNGDIICLGVNYQLHKEESMRYKKEDFKQEYSYPVYFSKRANKIYTNNDLIDGHFDIVDSLDYEVELALVIKKECKNVKKEDAFDYIFGYLVLNDISARNIQSRHKQWYLGKSMDTFTITNEVLVTKDEVGYPNLDIKSYVNGELRQNSNTSLLIYDIPYIIEDLSKAFTLMPGDIISTGTPNGVGMGFTPPKFLKSGDKIKCVIEKIGEMENTVK